MVDEVVEQAIALIQAGEIEQGRKILVGLLKEDPKIERAWTWMYACVQTDEQRIYCLRRVLEINPNHEKAKIALQKLTGAVSQSEPVLAEAKGEEQPTLPPPKVKKAKQKPKSKPRKAREPAAKKRVARKPQEKKIILVKPNENLYAVDRLPPANYPEPDTTMFGSILKVGGVSITPYDCPVCIDVGHLVDIRYCHHCEFFSPADCPLIYEPDLITETWMLFAQRKQYWLEYQERRISNIDAIYTELKQHGRPLHYELLAKIIKDRYPHLHLHARKIVRIMGFHPEKFEWVDSGVYKAR